MQNKKQLFFDGFAKGFITGIEIVVVITVPIGVLAPFIGLEDLQALLFAAGAGYGGGAAFAILKDKYKRNGSLWMK